MNKGYEKDIIPPPHYLTFLFVMYGLELYLRYSTLFAEGELDKKWLTFKNKLVS